MAWNLSYVIPTFVLLLIIAAAFFSRRRLAIRMNREFSGLLVSDILTMIADYLSIYMDIRNSGWNHWLLWFVNYVFFGMFVTRSCYFHRFTAALLEVNERRYHKLVHVLFILEQCFLLAACLKGWIFCFDQGVYYQGVLYPFINLQFLFWILLSLYLCHRAKDTEVNKQGICVYLFILLAGVMVRMLNPQMLIMNLFCLFALQVIYLLYMNPDQYIDDVTHLFNDKGWNRILNEADKHKDFALVGFGIRNYAGFRLLRGNRRKNSTLLAVSTWVSSTWPHLSTFYLGSGTFVILTDKNSDQEKMLKEISHRFAGSWMCDGTTMYLDINEMVMRPGIRKVSNDILRGSLYDAYHQLCSADKLKLMEIDDAMIQKHLRRVQVQTLFMDALNEDRLEMFLQPIVRADNGKVEGAEALCRLKDGNGGYIYPDAFIPIAMKNGSMNQLGEQMFHKACAFMAEEDVRFSSLKWINVNVAPEQFQNPNLLDEFLNILAQYHLDPSLIHLEITEESMIDRTLLHDSMLRFREKGFVFAMDDFGSSYSNVIRLQQNHFSAVKIDKDFTWSYFDHKTALLPDVIRTCHDVDMKVVVEGIETKEMLDEIRALHCDYIQGYYYSRPISCAAFKKKYIL